MVVPIAPTIALSGHHEGGVDVKRISQDGTMITVNASELILDIRLASNLPVFVNFGERT